MSKGKFDVKLASGWVKKRWGLVAFAGAALVAVPAMVYVATTMNASRQEAIDKQVAEDAKDFTASSVKYTVPGMTPSDPGIDWSFAPNEAVISRFKAARDRQQASSAGLVGKAVEFNRRDHKPLIENVFPSTPPNDLVLPKQFRRVFINDGVKALLAIVNAKEPIPVKQLTEVLREYETNALARELGTDASKGRSGLSEDRNKGLDAEMVGLRVEQYRRHGERLSVYAGPSIFTLPADVEANTPTPEQLWDWQVQYWTMTDILRAVASANASARDQGVTKSVVKRIVKLDVESSAGAGAQQSGEIDPVTGLPMVGGGGQSGPDFAKSITGRKSNALFDVRNATLTAVVTTKDLPALLDALAAVNLMTVTRVRMFEVDVGAELRGGFYYGPDHVTRVEIGLEMLWLREWTKDLMPKAVRVALGMEQADAQAAPAEGGAAPGGANPPPPPADAGGGGRRRAVGG